jgi:hypothetical protein
MVRVLRLDRPSFAEFLIPERTSRGDVGGELLAEACTLWLCSAYCPPLVACSAHTGYSLE